MMADQARRPGIRESEPARCVVSIEWNVRSGVSLCLKGSMHGAKCCHTFAKLENVIKSMLVALISAINGAKVLVWKPMAQPIACAEFVPQNCVDEMFVHLRYAESVKSAPGCGAQASVDTRE